MVNVRLGKKDVFLTNFTLGASCLITKVCYESSRTIRRISPINVAINTKHIRPRVRVKTRSHERLVAQLVRRHRVAWQSTKLSKALNCALVHTSNTPRHWKCNLFMGANPQLSSDERSRRVNLSLIGHCFNQSSDRRPKWTQPQFR